MNKPLYARFHAGIDLVVASSLTFFHVGTIAIILVNIFVPSTFRWYPIFTALGLYVLAGIGVDVGFHRYFAHKGFKTYWPIRWFLGAIGQLSGQSSILEWVGTHLKHHECSDKEGDPHSPRDGRWWSHMLWLFPRHTKEERAALLTYARALAKERYMRFLHHFYPYQNIGLGVLLGVIGYWIEGWLGASLMVLYGMCVRLTFLYHVTWSINSICHIWGYRNYDTDDDSRNCIWLALPTGGEAFHNNHHAIPAAACHGHKWWEKLLDLTYLTILLFEKLGLVWDVVRPKQISRTMGT